MPPAQNSHKNPPPPPHPSYKTWKSPEGHTRQQSRQKDMHKLTPPPPPLLQQIRQRKAHTHPPTRLVSQATPFLRKGSGTLQCNGLFWPHDFRWVLTQQTYLWLYTVQPRVHPAAIISQNNQLHCKIPDPLLRVGGSGQRDYY